MTWDAPYPRQNLSRLGWIGLLATGCIVVGFTSQGWFTAAYAAGGVEAAAMLYCIMRAEIGPTGWSAWHVEWLVERVFTACASRAGSLAQAFPTVVWGVSRDAADRTRAALDRQASLNRTRRATSSVATRLHGLIHTALLRARLTSTRAATTTSR